MDLLVVRFQTFLDLGKPDVHDFPDLLSREPVEDHDRGDTVEELRQEIRPQRVHDELFRGGVDLAVCGGVSREIFGTQVGGHDNDAVFRIDDSSLAIGDAAIIH